MNYKTMLVCFYLQRGKISQAKNLVLHLLTLNRLSTLLNTLMSFIYLHFIKDEKLGRKYFNVSQRLVMKNLGYIKSNEKNRHLSKSKKNKNKLLEKLPELTTQEKDDIWMELIVFFSNNYMAQLATDAITFLSHKETHKVFLINSGIAFLLRKYEESDMYLDKILETQEMLSPSQGAGLKGKKETPR